MDKDIRQYLKDERNSRRWDKTCKMPFRRIIRLHDADVWMRSEAAINVDAALRSIPYSKNADTHFKEFWDRIEPEL